MFRLRTFRGLTLELDGAPYTGPATQRRRLALLVLLADAESGMSRDRIIDVLWPDTDPARARHSLDTALSALRREFRSEALFVGVATLHVNPDVLSSDLADYGAALRANDPERLLELYTGPFLEGFSLPGAPDFERWMEAERGRRALTHARALGACASAASKRGDAAGAVRWGEARFAVDPLDTPATMHLMTALATNGDRTEALRIARLHETLIRQELDTSPGPEWAAAVDALLAQLAEPAEHGGAAPVLPPTPAKPPVEHVSSVAADAALVQLEPIASTPATAASTASWRTGARTPARSRVLAGALLALGLGALGVSQRRLLSPPRPEQATSGRLAATSVSVAVLPFVNTSGDAGDEPFSDGLTDELISELSKVSGIRVTGRTSAFALKGRGLDVRAIADTLGVNAVLEGSVRRAGNRLRVTAQLVSASDNGVLWTATYDRKTVDVFAVQEDIAHAIVAALPPTAGGRGTPNTVVHTRDLATYELYLRGRYFLGRRTPPDLRLAAAYFEQVVARDSMYAHAYAGLASARVLLVQLGDSPPRDQLPRARHAVAEAIRLDSTLSEAYAVSSNILEGFDWDSVGSDRASVRAIALDAGNVSAHLFRGIHLLNRGRFVDAVAELNQARTLDPLSAPVRMQLGRAFVRARRSEDAVTSLRIAVELNPEFSAAYLGLGDALLQQGRTNDALSAYRRAAELNGGRDSAQLAYGLAVTGERDAARAILAALLAPSRRKYLPPVPVARAFAGLGDKEAAFLWLERAATEHAAQTRTINATPTFDTLHDDPRWAILLRRLRLPT
ncbi:MAG: BTAD domain-containing putative transcriptional regulator [Gemmatimonadaceae bacterium]